MLMICPQYSLDMPKICLIYIQRYVQDIPKICLRYAQDMPKIFPRYAQYMPKICPRYAQDMPKISQRYAQDMTKICPRYAQDMPRICPDYHDMPTIFPRNSLYTQFTPFHSYLCFCHLCNYFIIHQAPYSQCMYSMLDFWPMQISVSPWWDKDRWGGIAHFIRLMLTIFRNL